MRFFPRKKTHPFAQVRTFRIYYGVVDGQALAALSLADLVIVEPRQITEEAVRHLQASGTLVLGYLSVMESPAWNDERFARLHRNDFLHRGGQRIHLLAWDAYLMDVRHTHYQELLYEEIQTQIAGKGMDGVFLDTVGDIEEYVPDEREQRELHLAYDYFLGNIFRQSSCSLILLQNRGFAALSYAAHHLHGVLWEDWRGDLLHDEWVRQRVELLRSYQRRLGLHLFAVSGSSDIVHRDTARRQGFVHLACPQGYDRL